MSAMSDDEPNAVVAYLVLYRTDRQDIIDDIPIEANSHFDIGRDDVRRALGLKELTISSHHLRFHCVMYGDEESDAVSPLVYARLLSSNNVILVQKAPSGGASTHLLSKDHPDVLLNHGDKIQLTPHVFIEFDATSEPANTLEPHQEAEIKSLAGKYAITTRKLGAGGYASVYLAKELDSQRQLACKILELPRRVAEAEGNTARHSTEAPADLIAEHSQHRRRCDRLRREVDILKRLAHPNIVQLEKAVYATRNVFIFQELITGGDLLSYLENKNDLAEPEVAIITFQVLKAVEYLHSHNVVHRDIKPENILMTSWREGARIVLSDFGQSRTLDDAKMDAQSIFRMQSLAGTYGYAAPEVLPQEKSDLKRRLGYSKAVDLWSVGCLAGTLFTNTLLFPKDTDDGDDEGDAPPNQDAEDCDAKYNLDFLDTAAEWTHVSGKAKNFIRSCVVVDESQRLTAKQALLHIWFTHRAYSADLQAAYARAIADWKPRTSTQDFVEYLDARDAVVSTSRNRYDAQLHAAVKSRHFATSLPPVPQFRSFEPSYNKPKQRHTPLPPINVDAALLGAALAESRTAIRDFASQLDTATSAAVDADATYYSVQDLAPPASLYSYPSGQTPSFTQAMKALDTGASFDPRMLELS